jgi:uncharacterized protein (UPF0248 family)
MKKLKKRIRAKILSLVEKCFSVIILDKFQHAYFQRVTNYNLEKIECEYEIERHLLQDPRYRDYIRMEIVQKLVKDLIKRNVLEMESYEDPYHRTVKMRGELILARKKS